MPSTPYIFGITVKNAAGVVESGVTVTLENESSGDTLTAVSNHVGQVLFDCGNFENGYSNGDYITYTAEGSGSGS